MASNDAKMKQLAEDYGYELAFLKSDPELYRVFSQAVAGSWDSTRFVAAVRGTKWYKRHSESTRAAIQLKYTDPASYNAEVSKTRAQLNAIADEIGAPIPGATMQDLAVQAHSFGWTQEQMRDHIARYTSITRLSGNAQTTAQQLRQTAYKNGVNLSDTYYNQVIRQVALGNLTLENAQQNIRDRYAKSVAPGFEKELAAGQDLYDLASPYMQTMAKTLEISPTDVDLFDPTIRKALASAGDKDGQAGAVPLWQFERELKKDQRWLKTNGARDELDRVGRSLSQAFGVGV